VQLALADDRARLIESLSEVSRLRAARFPEQDIDIFAAGNLRVRRDEMLWLVQARGRNVGSPSGIAASFVP
jgi:hypothetical protein